MGVGKCLGYIWVICNCLFSPYCFIWLFIAHQEAGGGSKIFQDLDENMKTSQVCCQ